MNSLWDLVRYSIVTLTLLLGCIASVASLIVTNQRQVEALLERRPRLYGGACLFLAIVALFFVPFAVGLLGGGQTSPFPWDAFSATSRRHGFWSATFDALLVFTADLWLFVIPGHLWARALAAKQGPRPLYPYIINILLGLLLTMPGNPIYRLIYRGSYDV